MRGSGRLIFFLLCLFCMVVGRTGGKIDMSGHKIDQRSPYYQHLPDCSNHSKPFVHKKTHWKGIVCPMVKDEVGFLSEWAAFYEMQGFDKVVFYDNQSNTTFDELKPWLNTGFVEIVQDWWPKNERLFRHKARKFQDMMRIKFLGEMQCKERAVREGYEVFMSVDLDEYVFPSTDSRTVMDDLHAWFNETTRGVLLLPKLQFNPTPHFLEPINLLTIEAFTTRMEDENKMNFYTSVSSKVALRMKWEGEYSNDTLDYLVYCCDFHGCRGSLPRCKPLHQKGERWKLEGKHKKWIPGAHIHHYARSLEKYAMKQRSWNTAGSQRDYDILNFLDRTLGFTYDNSAFSWTCQLRSLLANRTGERDYVRPGDSWVRNPEFGRTVEEEAKRGRYGSGYGKKLGVREMNPYPPGDTYQTAHKVYEGPK